MCRNTCLEAIQKVLKGLGDPKDVAVEEKREHFRISVPSTGPSSKILNECRKIAFAYLRLIEWESGGGSKRRGRATCVGGLGGEPLVPIVVRTRGETANARHALFGSRKGLIVANATRTLNSASVDVLRYRLEEYELLEPEILLKDTEFDLDCREKIGDLIPMEKDNILPIVEAVTRKVSCEFCIHTHYRALAPEDSASKTVEERPNASA